MKRLVELTKKAITTNKSLPFSIYYCKEKQSLRHIPIFNPVIVFVLSGTKTLGGDIDATCHAGQFLFLSENPGITLSNIPEKQDYLALYIEFEYQDFDDIKPTIRNTERFLIGSMNASLVKSVTQFIEWSEVTPKEMWNIRRKELIQILCYYGYQEIASMVSKPRINHQLIDVFKKDPSVRWSIKNVSKELAMSESTLRRRLKIEGTSFRDLDTQVRLAHGMHLLQTTDHKISIISEKCGYQSQSRFTERFKESFGITPKKLRQTQLKE